MCVYIYIYLYTPLRVHNIYVFYGVTYKEQARNIYFV